MLHPTAPVQPSYTRYQPIAQPGMLASEVNWSADSRIVETAAGIGFGLAVSQGALSDQGCILGGSAFVGISRADRTIARADVSPAIPVDIYPQGDNIGVLVTGDIWVLCYGSVAVGAAVTYDTTTGKIGAAGTTVPNARWQTTAAGSAGNPVLGVVRLGNIAMR